MDQQHGDAEPGYVSCMFCTARCFKLHGATSQGGCAAASTSSREMVLASKERSSGRKHRAPFFVKTVKITTVRRKNCELHLPAFFFKDYGDRFQKFVLLQGPSGQVWPVNLCVSCGSTTGRPTVRFSRGWKEFANDHRLELGDKLIFTLASFSRFSVQVFDPLGRKKPTSSTAVSGWSFRREEDEKDEPSRPQNKSIFVNWQNKVVRESSLGSSAAKNHGKGGQASRVAMLCRHLKRENKTPENKRSSSSLVAKLRSQSLPLTLLGQKWSSASSEDATQADDATNLLEWEPLETASPSQLWPLALKSSHSSKALDSSSQGATITSNPSSPGDQEEGDEEDPFQAYWKLHNTRSAISDHVAPWPAADSPQTLNVRTLEAPKTIAAPPSATLMSISHCLKPSVPQVQSSASQELLGFANSQESVRREILPQPNRISGDAEKSIQAFTVQSSVSQGLLGFANAYSKQESVRPESKLARVSELAEKTRIPSSVTQELLGFSNSSKQASVRIENQLPQRNQLEETAAEIIVSAPPKLKNKTPTPSRSDLSLAYFLHQPRPTAQKSTVHEDGEFSRLQKPSRPVSSQKLSEVRIKPQVLQRSSKENIPPGPLVVYTSAMRDHEVALPCKRSGMTAVQLPQEKKSRPLISDALGLSQAPVSASRRDKFQLDSSSKKMNYNSRVVISDSDHGLKVRNVMNLGLLTPQTSKVGSGNRCDLVELDDIASDDDDDDGSDDS